MKKAIAVIAIVAGVEIGFAGFASADVNNNPTTTCTAAAVCTPVNVPLLPNDHLLNDLLLHFGATG